MQRLVILVFLFFSSSVAIAGDITVLMIFGNSDNNASTVGRIAEALEYELFANAALTNSLITDRKFRIDPGLSLTFGYPGNGKTEEILDWILDEHDELLSPLRLFRDNQFGINLGADLILVSSEKQLTTPGEISGRDNICGATTRPETFVGLVHKNSKMVAQVTKSGAIGCDDILPITIPHELSHAIGAEHELASESVATQGVPKPYNHGYFDTSQGKSTVMYSSAGSNSTPRFSGSMGYTDDTQVQNVKRFLTENPWDTVSFYRSGNVGDGPSNPVAISCSVEEVGNSFLVSWAQQNTAPDPPPIEDVRYERKVPGGGWVFETEVAGVCIVWNVPATAFRLLATAGIWSSPYCYTSTPGTGGNPGGGPLGAIFRPSSNAPILTPDISFVDPVVPPIEPDVIDVIREAAY